MCQYYHNPHNDEIELMTHRQRDRGDQSASRRCATAGLGSYVPGVPRDVPPQLQAIVEYRIGAEFSSGGPTLDTLHPPEALDYLFEMADALGKPMRGTNIFSVSPLRLSGYEFDLAVAYRERWQEYLGHHLPGGGHLRAGPFPRGLGAFDRRGAGRGGDHARGQRGQAGLDLRRVCSPLTCAP